MRRCGRHRHRHSHHGEQHATRNPLHTHLTLSDVESHAKQRQHAGVRRCRSQPIHSACVRIDVRGIGLVRRARKNSCISSRASSARIPGHDRKAVIVPGRSPARTVDSSAPVRGSAAPKPQFRCVHGRSCLHTSGTAQWSRRGLRLSGDSFRRGVRRRELPRFRHVRWGRPRDRGWLNLRPTTAPFMTTTAPIGTSPVSRHARLGQRQFHEGVVRRRVGRLVRGFGSHLHCSGGLGGGVRRGPYAHR